MIQTDGACNRLSIIRGDSRRTRVRQPVADAARLPRPSVLHRLSVSAPKERPFFPAFATQIPMGELTTLQGIPMEPGPVRGFL